MPSRPLSRLSRLSRLIASAAASAVLAGSAPLALAQPADPVAVAPQDASLALDARDAWGRKDRARLAAARSAALAANHPLAAWVDYWELNNRLGEARQDELDAFYARWPGSYVEDRLRNDWLLELGRRRDWANFTREFPRFRMNDDREVTCYALLTEHLAGRNVAETARATWMAQRDIDDGCNLLATHLVEAGRFTQADVWRAARQAVEFNRPRVAKFATGLLGTKPNAAIVDILEQPARYLARRASVQTRTDAELATLALMRMAASDPEVAAQQLRQRWEADLPHDLAAIAWASVAKQSAFKLLPDAASHYDTAWRLAHQRGRAVIHWSDDTLAWGVRAMLRAGLSPHRTAMVRQLIGEMSPSIRTDNVWTYWQARSLQSSPSEDDRAEGQRLLAGLAGQLDFYGLLATEDLGKVLVLPPKPAPLEARERERARTHPGLLRALQLIGIGLRNEGVREWNFSVRGMADRELLAAAQWACDREVWDRCINTSDRTRVEVDLDQRFPMPFRDALVGKAHELGVDPAYVYGLIRQESRFVTDARSHVGASGLMQVMPATARWTAQKLGLRFTPDMITQRDVNLHLGTGYLKLVLDDFQGSQALAAAAYNAGPNRSRRWREGPVLEAAVWTENVPFHETRDYVKKVLANAVLYSALMNPAQPTSLKARLGSAIGPRELAAPTVNAELP